MMSYFFVLILSLPLFLFASPKKASYWNREIIPYPKHFLFGYGSLVNSDSRRNTFKEEVPVVPARISADFGYIRKWCYRSSTGMTALGLEKAAPGKGSTINGVLYSVKEEDMTIWDERESKYQRIEIPFEFIEATSWEGLPIKGKIWTYIPIGTSKQFGKDLHPPTFHYPIVETYLDICLLGFLEYGKGYAEEFLETTFGWSQWWLNDRLIPRRPWIYLEKYKKIDTLLENFMQTQPCNYYKSRARPIEYGEIPHLEQNCPK